MSGDLTLSAKDKAPRESAGAEVEEAWPAVLAAAVAGGDYSPARFALGQTAARLGRDVRGAAGLVVRGVVAGVLIQELVLLEPKIVPVVVFAAWSALEAAPVLAARRVRGALTGTAEQEGGGWWGAIDLLDALPTSVLTFLLAANLSDMGLSLGLAILGALGLSTVARVRYEVARQLEGLGRLDAWERALLDLARGLFLWPVDLVREVAWRRRHGVGVVRRLPSRFSVVAVVWAGAMRLGLSATLGAVVFAFPFFVLGGFALPLVWPVVFAVSIAFAVHVQAECTALAYTVAAVRARELGALDS